MDYDYLYLSVTLLCVYFMFFNFFNQYKLTDFQKHFSMVQVFLVPDVVN